MDAIPKGTITDPQPEPRPMNRAERRRAARQALPAFRKANALTAREFTLSMAARAFKSEGK